MLRNVGNVGNDCRASICVLLCSALYRSGVTSMCCCIGLHILDNCICSSPLKYCILSRNLCLIAHLALVGSHLRLSVIYCTYCTGHTAMVDLSLLPGSLFLPSVQLVRSFLIDMRQHFCAKPWRLVGIDHLSGTRVCDHSCTADSALSRCIVRSICNAPWKLH